MDLVRERTRTDVRFAPERAGPAGVRQQILMEPIGTPMLFAIDPVEAVRLTRTWANGRVAARHGANLPPGQSAPDKALAYDVYSRGEIPRIKRLSDPKIPSRVSISAVSQSPPDGSEVCRFEAARS